MTGSGAIAKAALTFGSGAMGTAEEPPVRFDAVPDHTTAAMLAFRRKRVNRTFEAVEAMRRAVENLERLVVVVPAHLAARHG